MGSSGGAGAPSKGPVTGGQHRTLNAERPRRPSRSPSPASPEYQGAVADTGQKELTWLLPSFPPVAPLLLSPLCPLIPPHPHLLLLPPLPPHHPVLRTSSASAPPVPSPGSPLPHVGAALTVTTHPHISIKSEPVSPSRERSPAPPPPAVFPATRPEPGDGLSSPAGGSYETGDRDDGRGDFGPTLGLLRPAPEPEADGSAVKRMRLDTWVL